MKSQSDHLPVSVVVPAWNVQDYLGRALDSILSQTMAVDEIIIVDDGSTDRTVDIAKGYGDQVRYLYQENSGVSAARNAGVEAATGTWIAFLDADDSWLPEKIAAQLNFLKEQPDLNWISCAYVLPGHPAGSESPRDGKILTFYQLDDQGVVVLPSCLLIRKDLFYQVGGFRVGRHFGEDTDLWLRIARTDPRIGYLSAPLVHYDFGRSGSANDIMQFSDRIHTICQMLDEHLQDSQDQPWRSDIIHFTLRRIGSYIKELCRSNQEDRGWELYRRYRGYLSLREKIEYFSRIRLPGMNRFFNWYHGGKMRINSPASG